MVETKLSMKPENLKIGALAIGALMKKKATIVRQFVDWYYFSGY